MLVEWCGDGFSICSAWDVVFICWKEGDDSLSEQSAAEEKREDEAAGDEYPCENLAKMSVHAGVCR